VIAGVGVSGGTTEQDIAIVEAAATSIDAPERQNGQGEASQSTQTPETVG
jgi:hypothetical protein